MPATPEYAAVRKVLERYIAASYAGDVESLKDVFHTQALMAGYLDDNLDVGTPEPFYAELEENESSESTGEAYHAEISFVHISGQLASAAVVEDNLLGFNYVNHFHLLKIRGEWQIVSKIYRTID